MIRIVYNLQTKKAIQYLQNITDSDRSYFSDTLYGKLEGLESTVEAQAQAIGVTNVEWTTNTLIDMNFTDFERTDSDQAFGLSLLREFNAGQKSVNDALNVYEAKMNAFSMIRRSLWEGHITKARELLSGLPETIIVDGQTVVLIDPATKTYFLAKMDNYLSEFI